MQPMNYMTNKITLINIILFLILITFKLNAHSQNAFNFRDGFIKEKSGIKNQFKASKVIIGTQLLSPENKKNQSFILVKSRLYTIKKTKPNVFNKILNSNLKLIFRISKNMNLVITYN